MKFIEFTRKNGDVYRWPAAVVAANRAAYYAYKDTGLTRKNKKTEEWNKIYQEELKFAMANKEELFDWMTNNMNWEDVSSQAILVKKGDDKITSEEFANGKYTVKDIM